MTESSTNRFARLGDDDLAGEQALFELLASQAAMAPENARLWAHLIAETRERRLAERALLASEARWRSLFENASVGIALTGAEGRFVATNTAFQRMTGYSGQELCSLSSVDITHEDDRAATRASFAAQLGRPSHPTRLEKRYRTKHGAVVWAELSIFPLPSEGGSSLFAGVAVDITDRKRAERELQRSEAYLAEGQRLSRTGSWGWDLRTGERFWSREMFRIYGFEPAESPPPFSEVLKLAHPDDVPAVLQALTAEPETLRDFRLKTRVRVGTQRKYVETIGHVVRDDEGRASELIGTVVDMTTRRRASRRLRAATKARFDAVLGERMRIARDMHDGLLQDINGIALQLAALLPHVQRAPDIVARELRHIVALAERTSREARRAVTGMRDPSEPAELVTALQFEAQRAAARGSLALSVRVSGSARAVPAPVRDVAVSVVQEAMSNVLKHADARLVELSIAFGRRRVGLSVRDDGRGLTAPDEERAGHLGLLGMRERAMGVGATLKVTSVPGKGTTIRLDAPVDR